MQGWLLWPDSGTFYHLGYFFRVMSGSLHDKNSEFLESLVAKFGWLVKFTVVNQRLNFMSIFLASFTKIGPFLLKSSGHTAPVYAALPLPVSCTSPPEHAFYKSKPSIGRMEPHSRASSFIYILWFVEIQWASHETNSKNMSLSSSQWIRYFTMPINLTLQWTYRVHKLPFVSKKDSNPRPLCRPPQDPSINVAVSTGVSTKDSETPTDKFA